MQFRNIIELIDKLRETKFTWMFLTHPSGDCEEFLVKNGKAWEIEVALNVLESLGIEHETEEHDFSCDKEEFSEEFDKAETDYFEFRNGLMGE